MHACQSRCEATLLQRLLLLATLASSARWSREPACDSTQGARPQAAACNLIFWLCLEALESMLVPLAQGYGDLHQQDPSQCHHHWRPQPECQIPVNSDLQLCATDQQQRWGAHCVCSVPAAECQRPAAGGVRSQLRCAVYEQWSCQTLHRTILAGQKESPSGHQHDMCRNGALIACRCAGQVATRGSPQRDASSTGNVNVLLQSLDTPASSAPSWANCSSPATYTVSPRLKHIIVPISPEESYQRFWFRAYIMFRLEMGPISFGELLILRNFAGHCT